MQPFIFATGNADKAREALEIFSAAVGQPLTSVPLQFAGSTFGYLIAGSVDIACTFATISAATHSVPTVEETGATLAANARIKALGVHAVTGAMCVADDTGLVVDALGGRPGVRSARYAGEHAAYTDNVALLLHELDGVSHAARTARFVTAVHIVDAYGNEHEVSGEVEGHIARAPSGEGTFGYDPVFVPVEGDGRTFAAMEPGDKHALSHRGRSLRACAKYLMKRDGNAS